MVKDFRFSNHDNVEVVTLEQLADEGRNPKPVIVLIRKTNDFGDRAASYYGQFYEKAKVGKSKFAEVYVDQENRNAILKLVNNVDKLEWETTVREAMKASLPEDKGKVPTTIPTTIMTVKNGKIGTMGRFFDDNDDLKHLVNFLNEVTDK